MSNSENSSEAYRVLDRESIPAYLAEIPNIIDVWER